MGTSHAMDMDNQRGMPPGFGLPGPPAGRQELSIGQLRACLERGGDTIGESGSPVPDGRPLVIHTVQALARRLERFNRTVPPGLNVKLSPYVAALCSGSTLVES